MKYVKVYDTDNQIVDALSDLHFVYWNAISNMVDDCSDVDARRMGLLSYDASTIWHLAGRPEFPVDRGYVTCQYSQIDKEEFEALRAALDNQDEDPADPEPPIPSGDDPVDAHTLEMIRQNKLAETSQACENVITHGFDTVLSDGQSHHFSLTVQDQLNLVTLLEMVRNGALEVPYHADDELCTKYSATDMLTIINTATTFKTYHTTYYNSLKAYIQAIDSVQELVAINYGVEIPEAYQSDVYKELIASLAQ